MQQDIFYSLGKIVVSSGCIVYTVSLEMVPVCWSLAFCGWFQRKLQLSPQPTELLKPFSREIMYISFKIQNLQINKYFHIICIILTLHSSCLQWKVIHKYFTQSYLSNIWTQLYLYIFELEYTFTVNPTSFIISNKNCSYNLEAYIYMYIHK